MRKIYYIGYYGEQKDYAEGRECTLSAVTKMNSIIQSMAENDCQIEVISASQVIENRISPGRKEIISDRIQLKLFWSVGKSSLCRKIFDYFFMQVQLFLYLLKIPSKSVLIVYHARKYMRLFTLLRKVKKFHFVLEVEEIYGKVLKNSRSIRNELKYFQRADAYIFPTSLLDNEINSQHKPFVVIHGTYQIEESRYDKFNDQKIHVVYAGTLTPEKGSFVAVKAAAFLPENYHVHILGFGSVDEVKKLEILIAKNSLSNHARITYEGVLSGEKYVEFIQRCDIGLSPQNPDADFNTTSFPSKILSYLSNGLHVVSIRIPAIEQSAVGDLLTFYDEQTPESIAKAVMEVPVNNVQYNSRERIELLNHKFQHDMVELFEKIEESNFI